MNLGPFIKGKFEKTNAQCRQKIQFLGPTGTTWHHRKLLWNFWGRTILVTSGVWKQKFQEKILKTWRKAMTIVDSFL